MLKFLFSLINSAIFNSIELSTLEVKHVLETLPLGKAIGPDSINNRVLKELDTEQAEPLCSLFNQSLNDALVPSFCKEAHVCPVFKSGDKSIVSNNRTIALLCTIEIILNKLYTNILLMFSKPITF